MGEVIARTDLEVKLLAALNAVHDHLHHDRVNEAHEACECALSGSGAVTQPNLTVGDAANVQVFIQKFNELAQSHKLIACTVIYLPSATKRGYVSVQKGGNVHACKILEAELGKKQSTYMGEHRG